MNHCNYVQVNATTLSDQLFCEYHAAPASSLVLLSKCCFSSRFTTQLRTPFCQWASEDSLDFWMFLISLKKACTYESIQVRKLASSSNYGAMEVHVSARKSNLHRLVRVSRQTIPVLHSLPGRTMSASLSGSLEPGNIQVPGCHI